MATQTMLTQVKNYVTATNKSGSKGLALFMAAIDHAFKHSDATEAAWMMNKSASADSALFKAIFRNVVGGVTVQTTSKKAKMQPSGMYIAGFGQGDNAGPTEKMQVLRKLVEAGESFRGKAVKEQLLGKEPTDPEVWDDQRALKYLQNVGDNLAKHGWTFEKLLNVQRSEDAKKSNVK